MRDTALALLALGIRIPQSLLIRADRVIPDRGAGWVSKLALGLSHGVALRYSFSLA